MAIVVVTLVITVVDTVMATLAAIMMVMVEKLTTQAISPEPQRRMLARDLPQAHELVEDLPQAHGMVAPAWGQHRNPLHQREHPVVRRREANPAAATHNVPLACSHKSKTTPPAHRNGVRRKGRRSIYRRMQRLSCPVTSAPCQKEKPG